MKRWVFFWACTLVVWVWTAWFFWTHDIPVLHPKGMIGEKQRDLFVIASLLMLIVVVPAYAMTVWFAWKYREKGKAKHDPEWSHNTLAEVIWWGVPCVIIVVLGVITWRTSHELNPFRPIMTEKRPLTIQVVALQWKWLFLYPEQGIATVNFVQFPENRPLDFVITADAPMNSFWIPGLGGQIYAMPAMRTEMHLVANQQGDFRGVSSNISGEGFAGMAFTARASSEEEFEEWVQSVLSESSALDYEQLMEPSSYNPVAMYLLDRENLFDEIIMKYRAP